MYAHYAAYVKGLESMTLAEHFAGAAQQEILARDFGITRGI